MPPESHDIAIEGSVTDLFGHRFAVATAKGKILADLGPKGAEGVRLSVGDKVALVGEQKPSELKVHSIRVHGQEHVVHAEKGPEPHPGDERAALAAVKALGFEPVGQPHRKPKHFEIVARRADEYLEFHVELDGAIRKTKPASPAKAGDRA